MADGSPRGLFVSLTPSMGAFFTKGTDHFRSSCEQIWQLILNKHKIIAWICWPYIYAEWWSKYSILWCSKPARELPAVLSGRASTWFNCLPACKESFLTRKEYAICRSPPQREAYSVGTRSVRGDLNVTSDRKKTEIQLAAGFKKIWPRHLCLEIQATAKMGNLAKNRHGKKLKWDYKRRSPCHVV